MFPQKIKLYLERDESFFENAVKLFPKKIKAKLVINERGN